MFFITQNKFISTSHKQPTHKKKDPDLGSTAVNAFILNFMLFLLLAFAARFILYINPGQALDILAAHGNQRVDSTLMIQALMKRIITLS